MYEITSASTSDQVVYYTYDTISANDRYSYTLVKMLNNEAKKYCNTQYSYLDSCEDSSVWAFDDADFSEITKSTLSSCKEISLPFFKTKRSFM